MWGDELAGDTRIDERGGQDAIKLWPCAQGERGCVGALNIADSLSLAQSQNI